MIFKLGHGLVQKFVRPINAFLPMWTFFPKERFPEQHTNLPPPSWCKDTEEMNIGLVEYHVTLLMSREAPLFLVLTYVN